MELLLAAAAKRDNSNKQEQEIRGPGHNHSDRRNPTAAASTASGNFGCGNSSLHCKYLQPIYSHSLCYISHCNLTGIITAIGCTHGSH